MPDTITTTYVKISELDPATTVNPTDELELSQAGTSRKGTLQQLKDAVLGGATDIAPIDSPVFTGNPQAPTPPAGDDDSTIPTTGWVQDEIDLAIDNATIDWSQVVNEPATYPPSVHVHAWDDITGKPATFPPDAHGHPISDVTGLQTALDGKAALSHTHTAAQITDFAEATDDRVAALLLAGSNITLTYNDASGTLTVAATATPFPEAPTDGQQYGRQSSGWTVVTPNPTWTTLSGKPSTFPPDPEAVDDRVAALLVAGANVTLTYNDAANQLIIAAAGGTSGGTDLIHDETPIIGTTDDGGLAYNNNGVFSINANAWVGIDGALTVTEANVNGHMYATGNVVGSLYVVCGDTYGFFSTSRGGFSTPASGVVTFWNDAETDFNRMQFGGTTALFPALKRSGATIQVRLADDSNYAALAAATPAGGAVGNEVVTASWVNTKAFVTGGPYLPLTGGSLSNSLTLTAGNVQASVGSLIAGPTGFLRWSGLTKLSSPVDGLMTLANSAGSLSVNLAVTTNNVLSVRNTANTLDGAITALAPAAGAVGNEVVTASWVNAKGYATTASVTASLANYLPIAGGTLTGGLTGTTGAFSGNLTTSGTFRATGNTTLNWAAPATAFPLVLRVGTNQVMEFRPGVNVAGAVAINAVNDLQNAFVGLEFLPSVTFDQNVAITGGLTGTTATFSNVLTVDTQALGSTVPGTFLSNLDNLTYVRAGNSSAGNNAQSGFLFDLAGVANGYGVLFVHKGSGNPYAALSLGPGITAGFYLPTLTYGVTPPTNDNSLRLATTQFVQANAVAVGAVAPSSPPDNRLWWNSDGSAGGGQLYIRYNDGNTTQWVPAAAPASPLPTAFNVAPAMNFVPPVINAWTSITPLVLGPVGNAGEKWLVNYGFSIGGNANDNHYGRIYDVARSTIIVPQIRISWTAGMQNAALFIAGSAIVTLVGPTTFTAQGYFSSNINATAVIDGSFITAMRVG